MDESILTQIPSVAIWPQGIFKYILIQGKIEQHNKFFVRGDRYSNYHADIFQKFGNQIKSMGFKIKYGPGQQNLTVQKNGQIIKFICIGGGRIEHNYKGNKCFIYGYSHSFGTADHQISRKLIAEVLGYDLQEIKISNEGY